MSSPTEWQVGWTPSSVAGQFIPDCERGSSFFTRPSDDESGAAFGPPPTSDPARHGSPADARRGCPSRDVANRTVQANVVVMLDVALHQSPRIFQRQRRSRPDALPVVMNCLAQKKSCRSSGWCYFVADGYRSSSVMSTSMRALPSQINHFPFRMDVSAQARDLRREAKRPLCRRVTRRGQSRVPGRNTRRFGEESGRRCPGYQRRPVRAPARRVVLRDYYFLVHFRSRPLFLNLRSRGLVLEPRASTADWGQPLWLQEPERASCSRLHPDSALWDKRTPSRHCLRGKTSCERPRGSRRDALQN